MIKPLIDFRDFKLRTTLYCNGNTQKYCLVTFIWMVTQFVFIHALYSAIKPYENTAHSQQLSFDWMFTHIWWSTINDITWNTIVLLNSFYFSAHSRDLKGATSSFVYFEKNGLTFQNLHFRFNLFHPQPSSFLFALESPLWCFFLSKLLFLGFPAL